MTSLTTYHVLTLQNGNMTRHKGGVVSTVQCIYQYSNTLATLYYVQAFLDFRGFNFLDLRFTAVYNSILFSSPLVLLSNLNLRGFCFCSFLYVSPH